MPSRFYMYAGVIVAGLVLGTALSHRSSSDPAAPQKLAVQMLPDLDMDGQPERLWVTPKDDQSVWVKLDNSKTPHTHDMLWFQAAGPFRFEVIPGGYQLRDGKDRVLARAKTYSLGEKMPTDLILIGGDLGLRYHWVDRGFMKFQLTNLIPGFSAGLLILGDRKAALDAIGFQPQANGYYQLPLPGGTLKALTCQVRFDKDGTVSDVAVDAPVFSTDAGIHPGVKTDVIKTKYQGQIKGERYLSPRFGLVGELAQPNMVKRVMISRPWNEKKGPVPTSM